MQQNELLLYTGFFTNILIVALCTYAAVMPIYKLIFGLLNFIKNRIYLNYGNKHSVPLKRIGTECNIFKEVFYGIKGNLQAFACK